jgi:hypothetical protein
MPSMPFAVIYRGEQPGSAANFAVVFAVSEAEGKDFGRSRGCSFAVFNSKISNRCSLLHTSRGARSHLSDRPGGTASAARFLIPGRSARNPVGEGYGNELQNLIDCPGCKRRRPAGGVAGPRTATGNAGSGLCHEGRAGAEIFRPSTRSGGASISTLMTAGAQDRGNRHQPVPDRGL